MCSAVESALAHECVDEVVIVDDGSQDNSRNLALELKERHPEVCVFTHPKNENRGAGASWNLAARKATNDWLAILGVDDIFLPNRFDAEMKICANNDNVDAVHGSMTSHFHTATAQEEYNAKGHGKMWSVELDPNCKPENVLSALMGMSQQHRGYFSLNALTLRKTLFDKSGGLNEALRLHQDSDFIVKISAAGRVVAGNLDSPICSRGVHEQNRIFNNRNLVESRCLLWTELAKWLRENRSSFAIGPSHLACADTNRKIYQSRSHHKLVFILLLPWIALRNLRSLRYRSCQRAIRECLR